MKLQYTEHRTTVNRDTVDTSGPFEDSQGFTRELMREVTVCLENDAHDVAIKLVRWHQAVLEQDMLKPGTKLVHNYGGGLDPVGTWEIIS